MEPLKITATAALDVHEAATAIEEDLGSFLKKNKGLYLPAKELPSIQEGRNYYRLTEQGLVQVEPGSPFTETVLDARGRVLVHKRQIKLLKPEPTIPVYGYRIIETLIRHFVDSSQAWKKQTDEELTDKLEKYFRTDINWAAAKVTLSQLYKRILEHTTLIRRDLDTFMFNEEIETEWYMHLVTRQGRLMFITRHQDFRAIEYRRLKDEGALAYLESTEGIEAFQQWKMKTNEKEKIKGLAAVDIATRHREFLASNYGSQCFWQWQASVSPGEIPVGELGKLAEAQLRFLNTPNGASCFRHWEKAIKNQSK